MTSSSTGFDMKQFIARVSPLQMAPNSAGADQCVELLKQELPFQVHEFPGGAECNGWIVPMKWEIETATIHDAAGALVYDGKHHPLAVIGYSQPFAGTVKGEELLRHLFFPAAYDDALVYHCDLFYKPFRKEWGFSVTKQFYDKIDPQADYRVNLVTRFEEGTMKVADYVLPGETEDCIVLNAHNCHAFCCNDDLSGVAVGIEVMKRLAQWPKRRFTYRLIVAAEHFGSIFYLNSLSEEAARKFKWGMFIESIGTTGPLALQRSFLGDTAIDRALLHSLRHSSQEWHTELFRKIVGNDETCWEAAGFEIPFPSLSRVPFKEYHTSNDGPELMDAQRLDDAAAVITRALFSLENDAVMQRHFRGLIALSHPHYDLYKPFIDPSEPGRREITDIERNWNYLMDCLPRYFDGETRISEIAERHEMTFEAVRDYVLQFAEKGLVSLLPAPVTSQPIRHLPPR